MTELTAVSLFAGVGGFELALGNHGVKVVASVEIDDAARGVLAHKFPDSKLFSDVKEVTGDDLIAAGFIPERGIITGGFPCQDLSVAGKRAGLDGARSGLYWEIVRLAEETQSKWLVLENVPGLLSSQKGRDMGIVLGTLVDRGYSVSWRVLDAQHFGIPQRRRRVFIVAGRTTDRRVGQILLEPEGSLRDSSSSQQARKDSARAVTTGTRTSSQRIGNFELYDMPDADVAPTMTARRTRDALVYPVARMRGFGDYIIDDTAGALKSRDYKDATDLVLDSRVRRLTPTECERLQGFPDGWTDGQANSSRYKQMGNAVAVPVVDWIIGRLVEADANDRQA